MTFVGPLLTLCVAKYTKRYGMMGSRTLFSFIGLLLGSALFSQWLSNIGSSEEALIGTSWIPVYFFLSWALFIGGIIIVVLAFTTSRRLKVQRKAS